MRTTLLALSIIALLTLSLTIVSRAQEVKRIPPPGVTVAQADREELESGVAELGKQIASLREQYKSTAAMLDLLPDVEIYYNSVRYALTYDEFFTPRDIPAGKKLLAEGLERAKALHKGQAPWTKAAGLILRGYVSKIDGSVQPYGMVVPASFAADPARKRPARSLVLRARRDA